MKINKLSLVFILLFVLLSMTMVPWIGGSNAIAADKIKIGTIMPISGPLSILGMSFGRGYAIITEFINEKGGVKVGGKSYELEIINEDSKGSAEASRTSALKLIHRDKVDFITGGILEPAIEAIYKVCLDNGVLFAAQNANIPGHPADISPDKVLQVRVFHSHDETHGIDIDYLKKAYPEAKKIAIAAPDIGYEPMIEDFKTRVAKEGLEVVFAEKWQWGTTDFVPVYTRVLASKPDAILAMVSGQAQYQLMAARQLGFQGVFISNSPLAPEVFLAVAGPDDVDNLITNGMHSDKPTAEIAKVIKRWKEKYNDAFVPDSLMGFDAVWVLVQAIEKAQSLDAKKVMAAFESMTNIGDLQTAFGPAKMGGMERFGTNRSLIRPLALTHLKKGKLVHADYIMP
jgi:branched-chain amino acid transport system substrate-binding protein